MDEESRKKRMTVRKQAEERDGGRLQERTGRRSGGRKERWRKRMGRRKKTGEGRKKEANTRYRIEDRR